ncbi:hypothetical protein Gpo141_00002935 [Globisporangium polare]
MERNDDAVDVQALKREVELLKTLLHQERKKSSSSSGASQRDVSPTRPVSPVKPLPNDRPSFRASANIKSQPALSSQQSDDGRESERSPRKNIALGSASQRGKSMRWNNTSSSAQTPATARDRTMYLQHVPVDTKRGKWWLKDRQVLSRNVPSPFDDCIAMKVRETWLWSGRTVVVDKIVTCPNVADEKDEFDALEDEELRQRSNSHEAPDEEYEERYDQQQSPVNKPKELYLDSKQLAQEFMQPKALSANSEKLKTNDAPLQAASARMEHQMSVAAAEITAEQEQTQPVGGDLPPSPGKPLMPVSEQ